MGSFRRIIVGLAVPVLIVTSACTNHAGPADGKREAVAKDAKAAALLPKEIKERGVLRVGGDAGVPPYLMKRGGKILGFEADLIHALGDVLGLKVEITNTRFASLVAGLTSDRIDIAMSDFSDTEERQQQVDFVDYTESGQILLVRKGNPKKLKTPADLCGHAVSAPKGTVSADIAKEQAKKCVEQRKKTVDVQLYQTSAESQVALQNGRADAIATDYAIATYQAKRSNGELEVVGKLFEKGYHGAAMTKGNTQLRKAIIAGFETLLKNGEYERILAKWNLKQMAMDKIVVNATGRENN